MTHGSLFSGIGGFDLAAQWMGWENVFHVERDPFCRQVLAHHFPESQSFDDVKAFDATPFRGRIRVLSGGFPCQPFSAAGKRAGTSDDRYLWPEMFRIIREARPTYVVAENVRGLISWNDGLVLDTVCSDLEGEGYEVFPVVLPAASVNAPHRRDRIWIVAHANDQRGTGGPRQVQGTDGEVPQRHDHAQSCNSSADAWQDFPTVPPVCGRNDGLPKRLDGITFPKWRRESIKAYGNAIVPQVAYQIFQALEDSYRRTA
jgi:DNA (cytosine-5)-methyltransferase 1